MISRTLSDEVRNELLPPYWMGNRSNQSDVSGTDDILALFLMQVDEHFIKEQWHLYSGREYWVERAIRYSFLNSRNQHCDNIHVANITRAPTHWVACGKS